MRMGDRRFYKQVFVVWSDQGSHNLPIEKPGALPLACPIGVNRLFARTEMIDQITDF